MRTLMIYETSKELGTGKRHYLQAIKEGLLTKHFTHVTNTKIDNFADDKFKIGNYDWIFVCIDSKKPEMYDHLIYKLYKKYKKLIFLLDKNDPLDDEVKFRMQNDDPKNYIFEFGPDNIKYIPLKKPFWNPKKKRVRRKIKNILVTFGGSDPSDYLSKFGKQLFSKKFRGYFKDVHFHIIKGKLSDSKSLFGGTYMHSYQNIPTKQMKELMEKCDLAICSGGNTLVELMTMGVPTIALAHNQKELDNIEGFIPHCIYAYNILDAFYELSKQFQYPKKYYNWRKNTVKSMQNRFDGKGVFRLLEAIGI